MTDREKPYSFGRGTCEIMTSLFTLDKNDNLMMGRFNGKLLNAERT